MRYLEMARALSGDLDVTPIPSETTLEVPMFVWCAIGKNVRQFASAGGKQ